MSHTNQNDLQIQILQNLEFFKQHQNIDLSHSFEIIGKENGPTLVITCAIHGNETAGVEATIQFVQYLETNHLKLVCGRIIFILGNPQAYEKGQRFVEENMNRAFLEQTSNTLEGKRALAIRHFLQKQYQVDFWLDLHSVSVGDFKMCAYLESEKNQETGLKISPLDMHFCLHPELLPGSTCAEADRLGAEGFLIECGNHKLQTTIDTALYHLIFLLQAQNMLPTGHFENLLHDLKPSKQVTIYSVLEIIPVHKDFSFVNEDVTTGTFVQKGEIYATSQQLEYTAGQDCYIVMPDKNPKLKDTDAGFLCQKKVVIRD